MRVKSVSELCGNEILAEPVLTDEKMILISRGSRLKKEYVPLIRSLGIDTLMVEDPYENYEMPSRIIDYSVFGKFVERVQRVMENHIYHKNKSLREFEVIANEVVRKSKVMLEEKKVKIEFNLSEEINVFADDFYIEQVISNYITNAIKHVKEIDGKKVISIVNEVNIEKNKVRVKIFNTGENIAEEHINRIWNRFYKVDFILDWILMLLR